MIHQGLLIIYVPALFLSSLSKVYANTALASALSSAATSIFRGHLPLTAVAAAANATLRSLEDFIFVSLYRAELAQQVLNTFEA